MVFLVGLGKLIKRIWKKYRWLSYAICIITFSTLYDYIHSIFTHTIICFPMWIWGIIPVVTILIFFAKFGIKKKSIFLQVVLGCCFGIVVTGVLGVLFYTTNIVFTQGCTSIKMLPSSTWKVPLNFFRSFCFSLNGRINK